MSIRVMTAVWDHAHGVSGGPLIVLLAMADYAHDDGTGVFPTQGVLAHKARMSERHVRRVLAELEDKGYIDRIGSRGPVIEWRVETQPDILSARTPMSAEPGHGCPTEPSKEPSGVEATASPPDLGKDEKGNGESSSSAAATGSRYLDPKSPGEQAAAWMVLELARLMRENDEKAKLPVALRDANLTAHTGTLAKPLTVAREQFDQAHPSVKPWLDAIRLLIDADGREAREIVKVLRWSQRDGFWRNQIKSAVNFRKHYDKMRGKALDDEGGAGAAAARRPEPRTPTSGAQLDKLAGRA